MISERTLYTFHWFKVNSAQNVCLLKPKSRYIMHVFFQLYLLNKRLRLHLKMDVKYLILHIAI